MESVRHDLVILVRLQQIYDQIDQLEKTEITMHSYMEYNEQFRWFLWPAMVLLLAEVVALALLAGALGVKIEIV